MSNNYHNHDEYSRLLAGAHRRQFIRVGAPALTRYMAFWLPPMAVSESPPDTTPLTEASRNAQRAATDTFIVRLYHDLKYAKKESYVSAVDINSRRHDNDGECLVLFGSIRDAATGLERLSNTFAPDSYRTIRISFMLNSTPVNIAFEMHEELVTVSMVIDASEVRSVSIVDGPIAGLEAQLNTVMIEDKNRATSLAAHKYLYFDVWDEIEDLVSHELFDKLRLVGHRLLDFRGLVLGAPHSGSEEDMFQPPFRRPRNRDFKLGRRESDEERERRKSKLVESLKVIWPFMTKEVALQNDRKPPADEYVLCHFLDGRAIYLSSLGSHGDRPLSNEELPVTYLLHTDRLNTWQLGRLIYRLHRAGSSRMAATMHFERLKRVGNDLRKIELDLQVAVSNLQSVDQNKDQRTTRQKVSLLSSSKIGASPQSPQDLRFEYNRIGTALNSSISQYGIDNEPLTYRIERSRYYVAQFESTARALRIKRIDGFQPYDEFVQQRLGSVFDFIDRLGKRYDRVQSGRAILLRGIQVLDYQKGQENAHALQEKISKIHLAADLALVGVLLPYYAASIVSHILGEDLEQTRLVWLMFMSLGGSRALDKLIAQCQWFRDRPSRRKVIAGLVPTTLAFAVYLLGNSLPASKEPVPRYADPAGQYQKGQ